MGLDLRCSECKGRLKEGETECPWCGHETPPRKKRELFSFASVWVMVAVLGILILALVYLLATSEPLEPSYHTTAQFSSPEISNRTVGTDVRWDASLDVVKVIPTDELHPWSNILIRLSRDGEKGPYLELRPFKETKLDDGSDGVIDIQAWYVDDEKRPGVLSRGDQIIITGMTEDYEGCMVELHIQDNFMAPSTVRLDDFV